MSSIRKHSNYNHKGSAVKPILIIVVVLLVLGGLYSIFGSKVNSGSKSEEAKIEKEGGEEVAVKSSGLDPKQKVANVAEVEEVIAKWVEQNPEAILQSVVKMQQKAMEKQMNEAKKNISSKLGDLYEHKADPVHAPKGYDVAVVEFFDYNCGYCKKAEVTAEKLIQDDKKVKFIYKEYPILGQASEELSKVSIAVNIVDPSDYAKFHNALMKSSAKTKDEALAIAKKAGINVDKVKKTLESHKSEIEAEIKFNRELGASIGVNGTPAFIIGSELVSGAVDVGILKEKVREQRAKK